MHTLDRILERLQASGKTQKELCEQLKIGKQAFTDWKSGKSESYKKYLPQIADYFGVSVDYLLGKEDKKEKPLTQNEELLEQLKDTHGHMAVVMGYGSAGQKVIPLTPEIEKLIQEELDKLST